MLEKIVWDEVKNLLNNPYYLESEYQRRVRELTKKPDQTQINKLNAEKKKLKNSISRLIDTYADGFINKMEFEPRITKMKLRLSSIEQHSKQFLNDEQLQIELENTIAYMKDFSIKVKEKLDNADWDTKRNIIKVLIKRIDITTEDVNVVFMVPPNIKIDSNKNFSGNCARSNCPSLSKG